MTRASCESLPGLLARSLSWLPLSNSPVALLSGTGRSCCCRSLPPCNDQCRLSAISLPNLAASMDHLGLHSAVHIGESGGAPYAAACAALHLRRSQALLLLAGLAAVHGREHAGLRKNLSAMDRFSMNWAARLGGARLISHFVKLAADVSAGWGVQVGVGLCGWRGVPVHHSLLHMAASSCCCFNADMRLAAAVVAMLTCACTPAPPTGPFLPPRACSPAHAERGQARRRRLAGALRRPVPSG